MMTGKTVQILIEHKKAVRTKELRVFGIGLGVLLGLVTVFLSWKGKHAGLIPLFSVFSVSSILIGCILPRLFTCPFRVWMLVAKGVGWFNTMLILSVIFVLLFVPMGLLGKIFGWDPLKTRSGQDEASFWIDRKSDNGKIVKYTKQY